MHRMPRTQSDRSLHHLLATTAWAVGIVVCAVSSAYAFSIGPQPGLNCGFPKPPCDLAGGIRFYEEVHQLITEEALSSLSFVPPSSSVSVQFSKQALKDIRDGNVRTDYNQGDHELHFDNAGLVEGGQWLKSNKLFILRKLQQASTMTAEEAKSMRMKFGSYLHTLQDFYAHSNYVNLSSLPVITLGDALPPAQPDKTFPCADAFGSTESTSHLGPDGKRYLTTGYAIDPLQNAIAPLGQCAHGGLVNGIHKDWRGRGGPDHDLARSYAIDASRQFAYSIINDPSITNKDNVCMLMSDKLCQNSTFTCPDNNPNISAIATISGYHGGDSKGADGPGPVQVSVSNDLGSATAGGQKGSASVTFNARMVNREGSGGRASVNYKDSFRITSSSKALGSQGTAILSAIGSASSSGTCQSDSMNGSDPVSTSASATITDSLSFSIGYEARFNCPDTIPAPPTPTSAMLNFGYGQIMSFSVTAVAAGQILGPPWGPSSSGSTTGSANISYNVSVQGDPDAVVTWCRAPAQ